MLKWNLMDSIFASAVHFMGHRFNLNGILYEICDDVAFRNRIDDALKTRSSDRQSVADAFTASLGFCFCIAGAFVTVRSSNLKRRACFDERRTQHPKRGLCRWHRF